MEFFFKKRRVVLDCFTHLHEAYEYCKIDHAVKFTPEWWKTTPKEIENLDGTKSLTIKNCHGFIDYYRRGIIIPSWFELKLFMREKNQEQMWYEWKSSNDKLEITNHYPNQFNGFAKDDGINLKINSVWQVKSKEEIFFTYNTPSWNSSEYMKYLHVMPGLLNFKYQHSTNINLFYLQNEHRKEITIPPRQPLVIMHPMTERKIQLKHHLVDKQEWDNIQSFRKLFLVQNYKSVKNLKDGCPFHK